MASEYAKFPKGKFNHFKPTLEVVGWYLKAAALEKEAQVASKAFDDAVFTYNRSDKAYVEQLFTVLHNLMNPRGGDTEQALVMAITHAKHAKEVASDPRLAARENQEALMLLIPRFCKFDEVAFKEAAAPYYKESESLGTLRQSASGAKGVANRKLGEALRGWEDIFVDPAFLDHMGEKERPMEAFRLAKEFVDVWRQRARFYLYPVTVEGTLIASLSDAKKAVWQKSYMDLEFTKLNRSDRYVPFKAEKELNLV